MPDHNYFSNLIWQIADLLRGPYRPPQYERVMLPLTVLRRFDCVLAPTKPAVVKRYEQVRDRYKGEALDRVLDKVAGQRFHNHSPLDFAKLKGDPDHVEKHLLSYIQGFSANVRRIFDYFELETEIEKMREANILFLVVSKFAEVDLHPSSVPNEQMGLIFENLIRRFNELANETAGDHFTPREVIRLMVSILFIHDDKLLATPGTVRKLLDPACGTGGMLAEAQNYLREHHAAARLYVYGQDYNKRAFATAAADMLMKQVDHNGGGENVKYGDSFTDDQFAGQRYDYFLTNPPFGVDWKKQQKEIQREHDKSGFDGRFGAGLPRVNDGALLFLQHMIHKFEPVRPAEQKHGSRLAIVFSGSPLFTGGAGSGESEIRRWIIENDWLEAIIALPEQMFYNTGIGTYVWIVTNRKEKRRKGKIQLIDAREIWTVGASAENKRSLGDKRRHMTGKQIEEVIRIYGRFEESQVSKIFRNAEFGYTRVTVERPLRLRFQLTPERSVAFLAEYPDLGEDLAVIRKALGTTPHLGWDVVSAKVDVLLKKNRASWKAPAKKAFRATFCEASPEAAPVKGPSLSGFEPDPALRDFENVPLEASIDEYIDREVRPHVPDAWIDRGKNKIGYELSFTFHFHQCKPPRPLDAIYADLSSSEEAVLRLLRERTAIARSLTCGVEEGTSVRDSGIGWIGQIPAHWKTQKAAWLFRERDQRGEPELPLLEVSIAQGVVLRELSDSRVESTAADFNTYKVARAGDVVFNKMRMWQGAVGVAPQDGLVSPDYVVAAPTGLLSSDFAHLLFRTDMFSAECARRSHGIVWDRLRLYWEGFREIELPVPPAQEQAAIVAHLAEEAKKVEGLRATTERSIALLRELIAAGVAGQIELPHGEN